MAKMPHVKTRGPKKVEEAFEAIGRQSVGVPGARETEGRAKRLAKRAQELQEPEAELDERITELSDLVPEAGLPLSVPGIGKVFASVIVCEISDIGRFKDANHLASYGGVAPVRHESGSSVRKRKRRKGGNRKPRNALIQSARCASRRDPRAKAYHGRKQDRHTDADGKRAPGAERKALRALARRRVDVIFALLRDGSPYEPSHQKTAA